MDQQLNPADHQVVLRPQPGPVVPYGSVPRDIGERVLAADGTNVQGVLNVIMQGTSGATLEKIMPFLRMMDGRTQAAVYNAAGPMIASMATHADATQAQIRELSDWSKGVVDYTARHVTECTQHVVDTITHAHRLFLEVAKRQEEKADGVVALIRNDIQAAGDQMKQGTTTMMQFAMDSQAAWQLAATRAHADSVRVVGEVVADGTATRQCLLTQSQNLAQRTVAAQESVVDSLMSSTQRTTAQVAGVSHRVSDIHTMVASSQVAASALKTDVVDLMSNLRAADDKVVTLQTGVERVRAKAASTFDKVDGMSADMTAMDGSIKEMSRKVGDSLLTIKQRLDDFHTQLRDNASAEQVKQIGDSLKTIESKTDAATERLASVLATSTENARCAGVITTAALKAVQGRLDDIVESKTFRDACTAAIQERFPPGHSAERVRQTVAGTEQAFAPTARAVDELGKNFARQEQQMSDVVDMVRSIAKSQDGLVAEVSGSAARDQGRRLSLRANGHGSGRGFGAGCLVGDAGGVQLGARDFGGGRAADVDVVRAPAVAAPPPAAVAAPPVAVAAPPVAVAAPPVAVAAPPAAVAAAPPVPAAAPHVAPPFAPAGAAAPAVAQQRPGFVAAPAEYPLPLDDPLVLAAASGVPPCLTLAAVHASLRVVAPVMQAANAAGADAQIAAQRVLEAQQAGARQDVVDPLVAAAGDAATRCFGVQGEETQMWNGITCMWSDAVYGPVQGLATREQSAAFEEFILAAREGAPACLVYDVRRLAYGARALCDALRKLTVVIIASRGGFKGAELRELRDAAMEQSQRRELRAVNPLLASLKEAVAKEKKGGKGEGAGAPQQ